MGPSGQWEMAGAGGRGVVVRGAGDIERGQDSWALKPTVPKGDRQPQGGWALTCLNRVR